MTVSLLEILAAARAHAAPLAAESAGYLLLAVADQLALSPRVVSPDEVELHGDGSVRLRARSAAVTGPEAEQLARRLLARTLEVSSSVGPALRRAAERREAVGLEGLVRELEVALIPVNRAAARRALSRVHRETERARAQGRLEALLRAEPDPVVVAEPVLAAADFPEPVASATPAPALPVVVAAAAPAPAIAVPAPRAAQPSPEPPRVARPAPPQAELFLSPPPLPATVVVAVAPAPVVAPPPLPEPSPSAPAVEDPVALTKPEPVIERARERGSSTPKLGTVVTAQTLPTEDHERTERAPAVAPEDEAEHEAEHEAEAAAPNDAADELDLPIEVELEPELSVAWVADEPQPLLDPSPSRMPDVLLAMVKVHAGIDADEAPTRLRDVVTAIRPALTPEPQIVEDTWLTQSSLDGVASAAVLPSIEMVDPSVHEALTWNPGPVAAKSEILPPPPVTTFDSVPEAPAVEAVAAAEPEPAFEPIPDLPVEPESLPASLLIAEPQELSPYAPAVLPGRESDVSELLDSFHVTSATEERDLRAALKEMAGLDLTPLPRQYVSR